MTEHEAITYLKAQGYRVFKPSPDSISLKERRRQWRQSEYYDGHITRTCQYPLCGKEFPVLKPSDCVRGYCCKKHRVQAAYLRKKEREQQKRYTEWLTRYTVEDVKKICDDTGQDAMRRDRNIKRFIIKCPECSSEDFEITEWSRGKTWQYHCQKCQHQFEWDMAEVDVEFYENITIEKI